MNWMLVVGSLAGMGFILYGLYIAKVVAISRRVEPVVIPIDEKPR